MKGVVGRSVRRAVIRRRRGIPPQTATSRMMPKTVSVARISRPSPSLASKHLPPFAMWTAFPSADYYGGSVALRLAAGDPTFPRCATYRARRRCRGRPLESGHSRSPTTRKVQATTTSSPYRRGPGSDAVRGECTLASPETAVRTVWSSPYRAGLAEHDHTRLLVVSALAACSGPV